MKRLVAISLVLFSPAMVGLMMALCCAFAVGMPRCSMPPTCHEPDQVKAGNCCEGFQAALANKALNGSQFTLAPPAGGSASALLLADAGSAPAQPVHLAPVSASPPVLNLRI